MQRLRLDPGRLLPWLVALGAGVCTLSRIGGYDIWYHLRAGQVILAAGLPRTDPFAFTAADQPFSVQSWLAEVIYWIPYRVAGIAGVQVFNAALVAATIGLVLAAMRLRTRGRDAAWAVAVLGVLLVFAARFRLGPRPHVLEYLFLATDLWVLQRFRAIGRGPLWVLPLVQVLWVNAHASHVLGLAAPALFLAGEALAWTGLFAPAEPAALPPRRHAAALGAAIAASAGATLASPQGLSAFTFPFALTSLSVYQGHIDEWQRLTWPLLAGYGARYTWAFSALVVVAAAGLAAQWRSASPVDVLLFLFFLALAFRGVRLIPEFALATAAGSAANLASAAGRLARGRERRFAWGALAGLALVAAPAAAMDRAYDWGFGAKERIFPGAALAFADQTGVSGHVFNSFGFGDWLTFHAPDRKVFIHGRNEVFPERFYQEYLDAHRDPAVFQRLVDRYDLQWLLLEYTLTDYSGEEAMPHLASNPDWVPIYWDRVSALYVRRSGPNAALGARLGFRLVHPARFDFEYLERLIGRGLARPMLEELAELVRRAPDNEEALLSEAFALHSMRRTGATRAALLRALAVNSDRAMTHSALGLLALEAGDAASARGELERALVLDPADPGAIGGLAQLGVQVEQSARPAGHP